MTRGVSRDDGKCTCISTDCNGHCTYLRAFYLRISASCLFSKTYANIFFMMRQMEKKKRASIQYDQEQYERLKESLDWSPLSLASAIHELTEWFINQPEEIQGVIIGALPNREKPEFAKMLLERMAEEEDDLPQPLQLPKTQPPLRSAARKKSKRK